MLTIINAFVSRMLQFFRDTPQNLLVTLPTPNKFFDYKIKRWVIYWNVLIGKFLGSSGECIILLRMFS